MKQTTTKFCVLNRNRKLSEWITTSFLIWIFVPVHADINSIIKNGVNHSPVEFAKFEMVKPTLQHGQSGREIFDTRLDNGFHVDDLSLSYVYRQKNVILDLKLNRKLIPDNHFMRYQSSNGTDIVQHFTKADIDFCQYEGKIRNNTASYVAISSCFGIKGVIFDGEETFYIERKPNASITDEHLLYRHSDRAHNLTRTTSGVTEHQNGLILPTELPISSRFRRSDHRKDRTIRGPYNANRQSSYVELVLVVDNAIFRELGSSLIKVHHYCSDLVNILNAMYVQLNVFVTLAGVVVWNERNMIRLPKNSDIILNSFLEYRRRFLVRDHPNDVAHLLTHQKFDGTVIGKAFIGSICSYERSGGVIYAHPLEFSLVAATVAHEMGHNLNMDHDTPHCRCDVKPCIMSETSGSVAAFHWSSCSRERLNLAFYNGYLYCLRNKPTTLTANVECGNGFVEPGEECDCGLREHCQNPCCDPNTCRLTSNAACATGECCDLSTCQLRTAGRVCRPSNGECDLPEHCTGQSEYCPEDYFKRDTELCGHGKAYCYQGACQSHDDQCKLLWGPGGSSIDDCYPNNEFGKANGNCGYDWLTKRYERCSKYDNKCGLVQCQSPSDSLAFGKESLADIRRSSSRMWPYVSCSTVILDVGVQSVNPGLTPDGAMCGRGRMCFQQKCVSLETLQDRGIGTECPQDCNGHGGVCNNKGFCYYEVADENGLAAKLNDGNSFLRFVCLVLWLCRCICVS